MDYRTLSLRIVSYVFVALVGIIIGSLLTVQQAKEYKRELNECRAEATAWYNASTAEMDELTRWSMFGDRNMPINTDIAVNFATQGHALRCIEAKFPTG